MSSCSTGIETISEGKFKETRKKNKLKEHNISVLYVCMLTYLYRVYVSLINYLKKCSISAE